MNLAVGGATDYWSDDFNYAHPKPWRTTSEIAMKEFWDGKLQNSYSAHDNSYRV